MRRAIAHVTNLTTVCQVAFCVLMFVTSDAFALTPDGELALAQAFAPTFLFHPDEMFFPVSPVDGELAEITDYDRADGSGALLDARIRAYAEQTMSWRLQRAAVFFRVAPVPHDGPQSRYRLEYWLYYVANRYRLRGGIIPFSADGNHPHDLEHVFLTVESLTPDASTPDQFWLREVWGSAHDGSSMPNNHFEWPSYGDSSNRLRMIVELAATRWRLMPTVTAASRRPAT